MRKIRHHAGWTAVFCALWVTVAAKPTWRHARTDHFEMYTTASEANSRELLNDLEQFRAGFRQALRLPQNGEAPVKVVVFDTSYQFEPYMPLYRGKVKRIAGYCTGSEADTFIALSAEDWDHARRTLFHEYVHRMVRESGFKPPLWLNEGLAEMYETAVIEKEAIRFGEAHALHVRRLRLHGVLPLAKLIAVTHSSPEYNESSKSSAFYGTSWLLTHYLLCGADQTGPERLRRFLELTAEGRGNTEEVFTEAFGITFSQMEERLETYMGSGEYRVLSSQVAFPSLASKLKFSPADEIAREATLEHLRWIVRSPRPESGFGGLPGASVSSGEKLDSVAKLDGLIERAPHSPKPHEVLASIALIEDRGRWERAKDHWEKAAALGSENAYVYFRLAGIPMRDVLRYYELDYRMPALVADPIRAHLDRAVALRPDYFEAWEMLAQLEAMAEKPRRSVLVRVQSLVSEMRKPERTLAALAVIRWHIKDYATCEQIVGTLDAQSPDKFVSKVVRVLGKRLNERERATPGGDGGVSKAPDPATVAESRP